MGKLLRFPATEQVIPSRQGRALASNQNLIEQFLAVQSASGSTQLTIDAYRTDLRQFSEFIVTDRLESVTRARLREYMGQLAALRLKARTIQRKQSALRSFYRFLLTDGLISKDPTTSLESPKPEHILPKHLERAEIEAILPLVPEDKDEFSRRNRAILELLYGAGLRASEIITLVVTDVDLTRRFARVRGKGDKERIAPFGQRAAEAVGAYLVGRSSPSRWLFSDKKGKPITRQRLWQIVASYSNTVGRHVHPHMLRHAFATHMVQNGAGLRAVQMMLGHSDIETTEIYAHISPAWVRKHYFNFHPRANGKGQQIRLQLELEPLVPVGVVICAECTNPAIEGYSRCERHLLLNKERSRKFRRLHPADSGVNCAIRN